MSIGNINTIGNKGSNFPYQRNMLKALSIIAGNGHDHGHGHGPSIVRIPSLLRISGAGVATLPAGAKEVSVYNAGVTNGLWLGTIIKQGEQFSYNVDGKDDVLSSFTYDALATELVITIVT